jgi:F0F1-type ATP synthase membrane subunit c/vacuolar-type H+-ATPase subunit K
MWSFINEYLNYIKAGLAVGLCVICFCGGYHIGNSRYLAYKTEVENAAKAQEAYNKSVEQQHQLINEGIKNEYEGKLAALRNYYGRMQLVPGSSSMSGISPTPKGTDAATAYPILVEQCAETTLQVNLWQEWATKNGLIK